MREQAWSCKRLTSRSIGLAVSAAVQEERPLYLFDKHFAEKCPELANDYSIPPYFADDLLYEQRVCDGVCVLVRALRVPCAHTALCCAGAVMSWLSMAHALLSHVAHESRDACRLDARARIEMPVSRCL